MPQVRIYVDEVWPVYFVEASAGMNPAELTWIPDDLLTELLATNAKYYTFQRYLHDQREKREDLLGRPDAGATEA